MAHSSAESELMEILHRVSDDEAEQILDFARSIEIQTAKMQRVINERKAIYSVSPLRIVHSDPEILGGTPVFTGTRVPVKTLLDYLEAGDSIDEFLDHFPSVSRTQAIAALEIGKEMLLVYANPA